MEGMLSLSSSSSKVTEHLLHAHAGRRPNSNVFAAGRSADLAFHGRIGIEEQ